MRRKTGKSSTSQEVKSQWSFDRLKRSFIDNGIVPPDEYEHTNLGSGTWNKVKIENRIAYYEHANIRKDLEGKQGWYPYIEEDYQRPYGSVLIGWSGEFINLVTANCNNEAINSTPFSFTKNVQEKLYKAKSFINPKMVLESSMNYKNPRTKGLRKSDRIKKIIKEMNRLYDTAIRELSQKDEEIQAELLIAELPPEKNIGYPLFQHQSKKTFAQVWSDTTQKLLGKRFPFTFMGIVDCAKYILSNPKLIIYISVYLQLFRTKTPEESRGVYGGNVILKGFGCLVRAAKRLFKLKIPKIGDLPFTNWQDWDDLFPQLAKVYNFNNTYGADIITYDKCVIDDDLSFIDDSFGFIGALWKCVKLSMREARVYFGPWILLWIYFVSGHPFTNEFGSYNHINLTSLIEEDTFKFLLHYIVSSDDDYMVTYDGFDFDDFRSRAEAYGYKIDPNDSYMSSRDHVVCFLKNAVGEVFTPKRIDIAGKFDSRYVNMIHEEVGDPVNFQLPDVENDDVQALIGQLASYRSSSICIVQPMFDKIVAATEVGKEAKRVIASKSEDELNASYGDADYVGFKAGWLKHLI